MRRFLEFEVTLLDLHPRIWRRFEVHEELSFVALHRAIQHAFGWEDVHAFSFSDPGRPPTLLCEPGGESLGFNPKFAGEEPIKAFYQTRRAGKRIHYLYDFGDRWLHEVKLVARHKRETDLQRRLIAGERACPPEDCGGSDGYADLVDLHATEPDSEYVLDWLGESDPAVFDVEARRAAFDG